MFGTNFDIRCDKMFSRVIKMLTDISAHRASHGDMMGYGNILNIFTWVGRGGVGAFPSQRSSNAELNKRLSKQWSCHWFETPWRSCDVTVMVNHYKLSILWLSSQGITRQILHVGVHIHVIHDDVMTWKRFSHYSSFVRWIYRYYTDGSPYIQGIPM